uniref:Uncharacterized protein n=1 Tax=Arundo donax TaxID=35708 RepID=A0A0A9H0J9_ARUDO
MICGYLSHNCSTSSWKNYWTS